MAFKLRLFPFCMLGFGCRRSCGLMAFAGRGCVYGIAAGICLLIGGLVNRISEIGHSVTGSFVLRCIFGVNFGGNC